MRVRGLRNTGQRLDPRAPGVIAALILAAASFACAQDFRIEPASAETLQSLPKPLRDSLDPQGVRLVASVNEVKTVICQMWWKKVIPAQAFARKPASVLYGGLKPGSLIGVVYFSNEAQAELFRRDFRGQVMEPGFYTMRYARIDQDKDLADIRNQEKGEQDDDTRVSPFRDFLVLGSIKTDTQLDRDLSFAEMFRIGRLTSRTKNPPILSLLQINPAYKKVPALITEDSGDCTVQTNLQQKGADGKLKDLPFAVLLVTPHISLGES